MIRIAVLIAALVALSACADGAGSQPSSDAQTMMFLGTGFLNGYNGARQAQPVVSTTCAVVGSTVNCLSY